jgi:predicted nuclease of predicted toxin-antitoxin system
MKFIVDAHLPKSLAYSLREKGFDVLHTSELPAGNDTTDTEINRLSIAENRIVISKDADFYDSFTAKKEPFKLLHVKTGNIKNTDLIALFERNMELIIKHLDESSVVQISQNYIIKVQ